MSDRTPPGGEDRSGIASSGARPAPGGFARLWCALPGAWVGLVFACLSFLPSLIPRPPMFQGLLTGLNGAIGYGLGVLGAWIWREFATRDPKRAGRKAWQIFGAVAVVAILVALGLGLMWQRASARLLDLEPQTPLSAVIVLPVAAVVFVVLIGVARLVRWVVVFLANRLRGRIGPRAARVVGAALVITLVVLVFNGFVEERLRESTNAGFALNDSGTPEGTQAPTSPLRSGSPASLTTWDTLGYQGRAFVARGPNATDIQAWSAAPALDPIRAYAGLDAAPDVESRAKLAVDDLERAGGFQRDTLLVVTTTGSGWVEPTSVSALEYLTGGDCATVSIQYSFLPSPLSFLTDQENARNAGRALFDAVYERWSKLPADARPKLYAFGESLGSYGAEAAFSGEFDMANRLSGAVFTGPPNFNPLYRLFVDRRDAGTREIEPVFREGRTVRFTTNPRRPAEPVGKPWDGTRVLYMQHPSDPITWWSSDLMWNRPDWLEEPRGDDVLGVTRWVPFVTFWQLTGDMALGMEPGPGHGHNFAGEHVDAWAQVLHVADWSPQRADSLRAAIDSAAGSPFVPAR